MARSIEANPYHDGDPTETFIRKLRAERETVQYVEARVEVASQYGGLVGAALAVARRRSADPLQDAVRAYKTAGARVFLPALGLTGETAIEGLAIPAFLTAFAYERGLSFAVQLDETRKANLAHRKKTYEDHLKELAGDPNMDRNLDVTLVAMSQKYLSETLFRDIREIAQIGRDLGRDFYKPHEELVWYTQWRVQYTQDILDRHRKLGTIPPTHRFQEMGSVRTDGRIR